MKNTIFTKSIAILIVICALFITGKAQKQGLPVVKSRLVKILQEKTITNDFIISTIESNGVDFELTKTVEAELRAAGADDDLIKAVKVNYRGENSQEEAEQDEDNQCPSKIGLAKIFEALKSDQVSQAQVVDFVKRCGVDFSLTAETRGELSKAGARAALLEAIAQNYRSSGNVVSNSNGSSPQAGLWSGTISNGYTGQTITFRVSGDAGTITNVYFKGYLRCRNTTSVIQDTQLAPLRDVAISGGAFADTQLNGSSVVRFDFDGTFTSATTASGTYRIQSGTDCDTYKLEWTASRVGQ